MVWGGHCGRRETGMGVSRKLGILVFFGVPAIIGGGITYSIFDGNYMPVLIYEIILCRSLEFFSADNIRTHLIARHFLIIATAQTLCSLV